MELQLAAVFHGSGHGDFVSVLDIAACWDAGGDSGDFDVVLTEGGGEPVR